MMPPPTQARGSPARATGWVPVTGAVTAGAWPLATGGETIPEALKLGPSVAAVETLGPGADPGNVVTAPDAVGGEGGGGALATVVFGIAWMARLM